MLVVVTCDCSTLGHSTYTASSIPTQQRGLRHDSPVHMGAACCRWLFADYELIEYPEHMVEAKEAELRARGLAPSAPLPAEAGAA